MASGTVKNVVIERGFGFIAPNDGGPDVFFHFRALVSLEWDEQLKGRRVEYEIGTDDRTGRERAVAVRPAR